MKQLIILINLLFSIANSILAQDPAVVSLDNLTLTTRNIQDANELIPVPEDDPAYIEPQVEVTIEFTVTNLQQLNIVEINFEKEKGKKDLKSFTLNHVVAEGKNYLTINNKFYEIINSKVAITEQVPATFLKRKIFFSVKALDGGHRPSNVLTKEFN